MQWQLYDSRLALPRWRRQDIVDFVCPVEQQFLVPSGSCVSSAGPPCLHRLAIGTRCLASVLTADLWASDVTRQVALARVLFKSLVRQPSEIHGFSSTQAPTHVPSWARPIADRVESIIDSVEAPFRGAMVRALDLALELNTCFDTPHSTFKLWLITFCSITARQ